MLSEDIAEILRSHRPSRPATTAELEAFERRTGVAMDPEFRAFYSACNGAELFPGTGDPYRILPLGAIARFGIAATRPPHPDDVYGFVELQDSDRVGFRPVASGLFPIVDMFHEEIWYEGWERRAVVIAHSLSEFLSRSLRHGGRAYWLDVPEVGGARP